MANKQLDEKIRALDYSPETLLAFPGNTVQNYTPYQDHFNGNTYIVAKTVKNKIDGNYNPAIVNAYVDVTYPGALVFTDENLVKNSPHPLVAERAPLTLNIDLAGMEKSSQTVVENPTYANVHAAVSGLVNTWLGQKEYSASTLQELTLRRVVDEKQLSLEFGVDGSYMAQKLGIDFDMAKKSKRTYFVAKFSQIFYTVSAQLPSNPSDVFAPQVTWEDLSHKGVSSKHPPAMIENVQYGQLLFIKFESNETADTLQAALDATINAKGAQLDADVKAKYEQILKNVSYSVISMGGNMNVFAGGNMINDISKINNAIQGNTKLNKSTPAYPLYYKAAFLKDNRPAIINGATEYTTTEYTEYSGGNLNLEHTGAYIARFYIYWDEVSQDPNTGKETSNPVEWTENGNNKTAKYTTTIGLRGNCRNIRVKAQGKTGLVWDQWRTSVDTPPMTLLPNRKVSIWGTTLNQKGSVNPEPNS